MNTLSYQNRTFHCGNKTVVRSTYILNGISCSDKTVSAYLISQLYNKWSLTGIKILPKCDKTVVSLNQRIMVKRVFKIQTPRIICFFRYLAFLCFIQKEMNDKRRWFSSAHLRFPAAIAPSQRPGRIVRRHHLHYGDVIMGTIACQITSLAIVFSTVYSDADQRKHQSSASLAFVRGIHRRPVNSPQKWPVTLKMFPFDDVIMRWQPIYIVSLSG